MKIIKISENKIFAKDLETIIDYLKRGEILVFPTDTVYGLGGDATLDWAVRKVFKIKDRPETKPLPVLVRDIEMAKKYVFADKKQEAVLEQLWPGRVTVVLEKRTALPLVLTGGGYTVGMRISSHWLLKEIFKVFDHPIIGTSANITDKPSTTKIEEVLNFFKGDYYKPDLIIDAGDLPSSEPSTVIDLTREPKILRAGPISKKDLDVLLKA